MKYLVIFALVLAGVYFYYSSDNNSDSVSSSQVASSNLNGSEALSQNEEESEHISDSAQKHDIAIDEDAILSNESAQKVMDEMTTSLDSATIDSSGADSNSVENLVADVVGDIKNNVNENAGVAAKPVDAVVYGGVESSDVESESSSSVKITADSKDASVSASIKNIDKSISDNAGKLANEGQAIAASASKIVTSSGISGSVVGSPIAVTENSVTENIDVDMISLLDAKLSNDIIYGSPDAKISIVEYASLSCSHCAKFHENVIGGIKNKYIDSGKVKVIFRHYPLNAPALKASLLVDCVEGDSKKKLLDALFDAQSDWAFTKDFSSQLQKAASVASIDKKTFNDCISDKEKEDVILAQQLKAHRELEVSSTPAVFIDGRPFTGGKNVDAVSAVLDKLLK